MTLETSNVFDLGPQAPWPTGVVVPAVGESSDVPLGLASVLVPCCGQLEYTRLCVPSLLRHSRRPYELVFLDVGSVDGTAAYLEGLAAAAAVRVEVVRTLTDQGLAAACDEALARARGEYLVLLNNDTVVPENWLAQLVALANLSPQIGLVGPMSNHAAPPQLVEAVPYRLRRPKDTALRGDGVVTPVRLDVSGVDPFAREWQQQHAGKWCEVEQLGGFCLLIKREVLRKIGLPQQGSGLDVFDAAALCTRARQAGYRLACCRDLFVHHFGSRSPAPRPADPDTR